MPDDIFYGDDEDIYASWYGWHNNKSNVKIIYFMGMRKRWDGS